VSSRFYPGCTVWIQMWVFRGFWKKNESEQSGSAEYISGGAIADLPAPKTFGSRLLG
jgi:hypothetical protein